MFYIILFFILIIIFLYYYFRDTKKEKICFAIPSTTNNREWKNINETYLYKSINNLNKLTDKYVIYIYISYDINDIIYSISKERDKLINKYSNFNIKWFKNDFEKGNVVAHWNFLYEKSVNNNIYYTYLIGDDIIYPNNSYWLDDLIDGLKKNNNIGISGGDSGNPSLPMTQFLISKKHYDIFNYAFNPLIKNWYCDNYLLELYPEKYINYFHQYKLYNTGGSPRYIINNIKDKYKSYVLIDRKKLYNFMI
jgi:hypothetical protein